MLVYTSPEPVDAEAARREQEAHLERLRAIDFRRSPDLPRYFALHFFNDGAFERFEYDPHANSLVLEMESIPALNDVYDLRARCGLPREMPHRCEDFRYTCTFTGVAYLQIRRTPMRIEHSETGEVVYALSESGLKDDYQQGRVVETPLRDELQAQAGVPLFHLQFETGWAKKVDVIFEKVTVRKVNAVKYESYTEGRRVRLTRLFRG